ncbi:hypothetical protein GN956_G20711 [Arapaima gigas]
MLRLPQKPATLPQSFAAAASRNCGISPHFETTPTESWHWPAPHKGKTFRKYNWPPWTVRHTFPDLGRVLAGCPFVKREETVARNDLPWRSPS